MNTKKHFFLSIICIMLFVTLTTAPLCAKGIHPKQEGGGEQAVVSDDTQSENSQHNNTQTEPQTINKDENIIDNEDVKSVDDPNFKDNQSDTQSMEDEDKQVDLADKETIDDLPKTEEIKVIKKTNNPKTEQTASDENIKSTINTGSKHLFLQKILIYINNQKGNPFFDKIISLEDNLIHHCSTFKFLDNYLPKETKIGKNQNGYDPCIIPYYYINPKTTFGNCDLNFFVNPEKITSIEDLMPYHILNKITQFKLPVPSNAITPEGTEDALVLMNAPSPQIVVKGKDLTAKLVIDIRNNTLYKYDIKGFPLKAYLVATGARGMRTKPGLRIVTHKEHFPYSNAPESKRAKDPYSYGPHIIFVNIINPETGSQRSIEQLLHGNGSEYSIGKKVSHGCVRTNNKVMDKELSKEVTRGDYILLINPDKDI